jgi:hypothetical protein
MVDVSGTVGKVTCELYKVLTHLKHVEYFPLVVKDAKNIAPH